MKRKYLALIAIVLILSSFLLASTLLREENESMTLLDGHSQSHYTSDHALLAVHPSASLASAYGQAFTVKTTGEKYKLTPAIFYLKKVGSPTGHLKACLYSMTGTYGTSAKPYGAPLASSELIDIADLGTSYGPVAFSFVGAQQYEVLKDHKYCIEVQVNDGSLNSNNCVWCKASSGAEATHDGNESYYSVSAWRSFSDKDFCFLVYGEYVEPPPPPPEDEYGLQISSDKGGHTTPAEGTYSYEEPTNVEVTASADEYYEFDYWTLDGVAKYSNPITVSVDRLNETRDLRAYFYLAEEPPPPPTKYTLTVVYGDAHGHTNPPEGEYSIKEGNVQPVLAIAHEGYELDYWMLDGEKRGDNPTNVTMTKNYTLTVYFRLIPAPSGKCEDVWISNITQTGACGLRVDDAHSQSQKILVENKTICSVSFMLKKENGASGTIYARIREIADDMSEESIIETSETTIEAADLTTAYAWYSFPFWSLVNKEVRICVEFQGAILVYVGRTADLISGNRSYYFLDAWREATNEDLCIRIYEGKGSCPILAVRIGGSKALLITGKDKGKVVILV